MVHIADANSHPDAPFVLMPWLERVRVVRNYHTGGEAIRDSAGPVALVKLGPRRLVPLVAVVSSPQGARDVLGATGDALDKTGLTDQETRLWGDNLLNMAHEPWLPRRRTLQPLFTKKQVGTFAGHMVGCSHELVIAWLANGRIDLDEQCRRLTLQVLGRSVLGLDLGERALRLAPHFERVLSYTVRRIANPVRVPASTPTPARWRYRRSLNELRAVAAEAIAAVRADPSRDAPLVRLLVDAVDPLTGQPLSDDAIRDELIIFLIAGHDTTSTTLTYALWALGRHPMIQDRVAAECAEQGQTALSIDDLVRLPYTAQVMQEAMRLCPPVASVSRFANRDVVIDGRRVPGGANVYVQVWALHHDPALWEEPERFDPDRFSPEQSAGRGRWQYLPFGGPRSCIGDHFARLEATLGLATLIRAVQVNSERDEFPINPSMTLRAAGKVPATVTSRDRSRQTDRA